MKMKTKAIALSIGLLGALAAVPAHAYVYADARLLVQNLTLTVTGNPVAGNFTFTSTDSATLNNVSDFHTANCFGSGPGAPGTTNNCSSGVTRLNPGAANAPGSSAAANRGNMDFAFKGPNGTMQFSNSATSVDQSNLTGDGSTAFRQVAESQLTGNATASANADLQSTTGFTFTFTMNAPGSLLLDLQANPDLFAAISESMNGAFSAQSTLAASFTLQQDGTTNFAKFAPDGSGLDCVVSGLTCLVRADGANLNQTIGVTTNNTSAQASHGDPDTTFANFGITVSNLLAGRYTLTLAANTKTQLTRLVVPEPESLGLLGIGVAALAIAGRRRSRKQAA